MADVSGFLDISLTFEGQAPLQQRFATWGARVADLSPAWEQVGTALLRDFESQFVQEGGWLGAQVGPDWDALRPATVRDRIRRGYGGEHPILHRTGALEASATQRNASGNIFEVKPDGVTVGTDYPIAKYHQYGTRKMVARRMIGLRWDMRAKVVKIIGDYIRSAAWAAGFMATGSMSE